MDQMVKLYLALLRARKLSPEVAIQFSICNINELEFLLLHSLTSMCYCQDVGCSHFNVCAVVSHCYFNLKFSNDKWRSASFYMLFTICISPLVMYLFIYYFVHFRILFSYCYNLRSLYILNASPFSDVFCKYFLLVCRLSLKISFTEKRDFILIYKIQLIMFFFLLMLYLKTHCQNQSHLKLLLCFLLHTIYTFTFYI